MLHLSFGDEDESTCYSKTGLKLLLAVLSDRIQVKHSDYPYGLRFHMGRCTPFSVARSDDTLFVEARIRKKT
jgi:hypothetical protein